MAEAELIVFLIDNAGELFPRRGTIDQIIVTVQFSNLRLDSNFRMNGIPDEDGIVVDERSQARASSVVHSAIIGHIIGPAVVNPFGIDAVSIVDADVVAVATIDVVAQHFCEASFIVEAQVVLDDHILVSVVDMGTVGILRPVCIHQPVVLNEYALAFEGPCAASAFPHSLVHT